MGCDRVWDWSRRQRLTSFINGNPKAASITSLNIINQDVGGIILVTSGAHLTDWSFV